MIRNKLIRILNKNPMITQTISFEQMEFGMFRKLSGSLGISFSEIIELEPVLFPVYTSDSVIIGYLASFDPSASKEIFKKIKGLSSGHSVFLGYYLINDLLPDAEVNN